MLLTEKTRIKITKKNILHIQSKGYECKVKDIIEINTIDMNKGSHILVKVKCDVCGEKKEIFWQKYIKNINNGGFYACSSKCAQEKVKKTSLERFGQEYYMQTNKYKEEVKRTSLEKYACEHFTQNENIKEKIRQTNIERYGVDVVWKNKEIKDKIKQINIHKYGVDNPFKSEIIKDKIKQISLEKYGVDKPSKNKEIIERIKKTNLEKYGTTSVFKLDWVQEKAKLSYFEKYGVSLGQKTKEMIKKIKENKSKKWIEKVLTNYPELKFLSNNYENRTLKFICDHGHEFDIPSVVLIQRNSHKTTLCTICNPIERHVSGLECQLLNFIKKNYDGEILENKKIIPPYEIDIFLPELKIGFEFNGLFWHSEANKDSNYHLKKTEYAEAKNIHLIHIYEDDWLLKQDIVKSRILYLLGKSEKLYAHKCEIKENINNKEIREFLQSNHIQGFVGAKIKIGLYFENKLVSLMTFGKLRKALGQNNEENEYEMLRFCNEKSLNVIGGASKLLSNFIKNYNPKKIISYADRSWSNGGLYNQIGFTLMHKTTPNYYYIIDKTIRKHKFNYRKDKLVKEGANPSKTEHEIMLERGFYRIYDSGNLKFVKKF
jgi:hypothetical protein